MTADFGWLVEAEARAAAATPGPWHYTNGPQGPRVWEPDDDPDQPGALLIAAVFNDDSRSHAAVNAEFVAHARTDIERMAGALRAILDLHQQRGVTNCTGCNRAWPCPTVRAIVSGEAT